MRTRSQAERVVQRSNMQIIRALGYQPFHIPNGVRYAGTKEQRIKQAMALRKDGLRAGFPDAGILASGGRFGVIEFKEPGEFKLDPDQEYWRDECRRLGIPWALVNTNDGCLAVFKEWGWRG